MHYLARKALFRETNEENLNRLFNLMLEDENGSHIIKKWMKPHAVDLVCDLVHDEMDQAKPSGLYMTTNNTTPEFIESWDINDIMDPVANVVTPTRSAVLDAATETKSATRKSNRHKVS